MGKLLAFLIRDYRIQLSYRFAFILQTAGIFMSAAGFFFVAKLVGPAANPYLRPYGGDYFAFVLIGLAFSGFMNTGLTTFSAGVSAAQAQGTLEAMLATPARLSEIVLYSSLWSFFYSSLSVFIYLVFGRLIFGVDLGKANLPAALLILALTLIIFSGLGIMSAGFIMMFKRGDPVNWAFGNISALVSGAYFPIAVLPGWLQSASGFFPLYYALHGMRLAVLMGAGIVQLKADILALAGFGLLILPLSLLMFKAAVRQTKIDGSLCTY